MNALGYSLVFGTLAGFTALLALWLVAENRWSKRSRITLGLLAILTAIPVTALVAVAVTQLDDQSYYAASVRTLLDETVVALGVRRAWFSPSTQDLSREADVDVRITKQPPRERPSFQG